MSRTARVVVSSLSAVTMSVCALAWTFSGGASVAAAPTSAESLPVVRRESVPWARWTVTEQFAAQHMLILQVETRHLGEALAIARQLTEPVKPHFTEVMIYFHRPGRPDTLPPRRVQWDRDRGYVEANYEQP